MDGKVYKYEKYTYSMMEEKILRRICESEWHKEIELKSFERCPYCNSIAYHKGVWISKPTLDK